MIFSRSGALDAGSFAGPDDPAALAQKVAGGEGFDWFFYQSDADRAAQIRTPGVRNRWDDVNALEVRVEGRSPQSHSVASVLGGDNALLLETTAGWELAQFRQATLLGDDVWRLSGLLRGQQGTDQATAAGAAEGALVVFIDPDLARVEFSSAERGLPLVWRAAPTGAPPGGPRAAEMVFAVSGLHDRPWSPAHLRSAARADGGFDLSWVARLRVGGDRWDVEPAPVDGLRFRVSILDGAVSVRRFEIEGLAAVYAAPDLTADFPEGPTFARVAVAQWSDGFGWGAETVRNLV